MSRQATTQRAHALDRLRERHCPDATPDDLIEVESPYRDGVRRGMGSIEPGSDVVVVAVWWRSIEIRAVFIPRFDCLRTILPAPEKAASNALSEAFRRAGVANRPAEMLA